jgi:ABC-type antimicrobial peptide transport system, permease component
MLKQNLFISIISILGTALAITMIMTIIVTDEVRTLSIAPEINRDRTLYVTYHVKRDTIKGNMSAGSGVSPNILNEYILKMKTPEYISARRETWSNVSIEGFNEYTQFLVGQVDAAFWKIFSFDFIEGNPFSEEEFKSGISNAVLSESSARKLFKGEKALGRTIEIAFQKFKVIGIVKNVSPVFKFAKGDIWIPYTANGSSFRGGNVLLMAKEKEDFPKIIAEVRDIERKYAIDHHPEMLYLKGPDNQKINTMDIRGNNEQELKEAIKTANRRSLIIFLILLIIPALNLSGFSLSRIKKRVAEIGVRKAFGAKKQVILIQVLYENMITSLMGGIIGLFLSYAAVVWLKTWLLKIPEGSDIPLSALLSPGVFAAVFTVCFLLNLLSAGWSAFQASRMTIVNSLNKNDR